MSELKPKFEDEFPQDPNMSEENEKQYDLGLINAAQAQETTDSSTPLSSEAPSRFEKPSHPDGGAYKGKHPISPSSRQRMIGESDWKAETYYGPKK